MAKPSGPKPGSGICLPIFSREHCNGCALCVDYCPVAAIEMVDGFPELCKPEECAYCALCEELCPEEGAIQMHGECLGRSHKTE